VAILAYHLFYSGQTSRQKFGYYEITYRNLNVSAVYIDEKTNTAQEVPVEEVERSFGKRFPRYESK